MKQPGFMIYAEDWGQYTEDYSDEELGQMLRALLSYFDTREQPSFSDRGMRQFFKQAAKGIDLDIRRYTDKCRQNAYNRYRGTCKQKHEKPLPFEQWLTTVDDGHQTSPIPTPTSNNQLSTINTQQSEINNQQSKSVLNTKASSGAVFDAAQYRPMSEDEFEKRRERAIASLRAVSQCM